MIVAAENAFGEDILDLLRTHIDRIKFSDQSTEYQATTSELCSEAAFSALWWSQMVLSVQFELLDQQKMK